MQNTCMLLRVLWEDDRYGRIALVMDRGTCARRLSVEVPSGRTAAGQVIWRPLDELSGAESEAAQTLLTLVHELAGDVCYYTMPQQTLDPFVASEE